MTSYGSSKLMEAITFDGIFSNQQTQNPGKWLSVALHQSTVVHY
jgi:hypothetical protein